MSEKRFRVMNHDDYELDYIAMETVSKWKKMDLYEICDLLNKQDKENKLLREMLKNSYINEICENCEYGHYYGYEVPFEGIEYDFECLKKHFGNEHWRCDGLKECDDFKLKLEELE